MEALFRFLGCDPFPLRRGRFPHDPSVTGILIAIIRRAAMMS
jgi:hypothetical protein